MSIVHQIITDIIVSVAVLVLVGILDRHVLPRLVLVLRVSIRRLVESKMLGITS